MASSPGLTKPSHNRITVRHGEALPTCPLSNDRAGLLQCINSIVNSPGSTYTANAIALAGAHLEEYSVADVSRRKIVEGVCVYIADVYLCTIKK